MTLQTYYWFLAIMAALALVVFVALYFVEAGYGYLFNPNSAVRSPTRSAGC